MNSKRIKIYSDKELFRKRHDYPVTERMSQSVRDYLIFMVDMAPLEAIIELTAVLMWIDGYTQSDISAVVGVKQQDVSRLLPIALKKVLDTALIGFDAFSTVSRKYSIERIEFQL